MRKTLATLVLLLAASCNRTRPAAVAGERPALPDIAGFSAGPVETTAEALRRTYTGGTARVTVTLARLAMTDPQYAEWVKASTASFPQAALAVGPDLGNGFYQCDAVGAHCDLLVQLRSGVHLELRGGGTSTRADVDAIARGLPLGHLARPGAALRPLSFRHDVAPVLARTCAGSDGCHGPDPTHRVRLDLREGAAHAALVGQPSELRAGALRVEPGHPARSFLVDKLTRHLARGEGRPMPLDPQTGNIQDPSPVEGFVWSALVPWIAQGAADN
jgi:hypothetical protein